jgi:hypothetical protein
MHVPTYLCAPVTGGAPYQGSLEIYHPKHDPVAAYVSQSKCRAGIRYDLGKGHPLLGRCTPKATVNGRSGLHSPNRPPSENRLKRSTPPMYIRNPEATLLRSFLSSRMRKAEVHSPMRQRYSEIRTMTEPKFLTTEEVFDRYRGAISIGTLKNWRSLRIGPSFVKLGKTILYPVEHLDRWDQENFVTCRAPKGGRTAAREQS